MYRFIAFSLISLTALTAQAAETRQQEFDKAYKRAILGDIEAQNTISDMYHQGYGVAQSNKDACLWADRAAKEDYPPALYNSARCKLDETPPEALNMLDKASEKGHIPSTLLLARLYATGNENIPQDISRAVEYYNQAVEHDNTDAMAELALLYMRPVNNLKDKPRGVELMKQAAGLGSADAAAALGKMYWLGDGVEKDADLARVWMTAAADNKHIGAMEDLGIIGLRESISPEGKMNIELALQAYKWLVQIDTASLSPVGTKSLGILEQYLPDEQKTRIRNEVTAEAETERL